MFRNNYLWLFLLSLMLTVAARHFYAESYRREMKTVFSEQQLNVVRQRAEAFFQPDPELASHTAAEILEHEQNQTDHKCGDACEHHHSTCIKLGVNEIDLQTPSNNHISCENHAHHDHHADHKHGDQDSAISPGFVLLLRQLGFAELAANLLWIQMDADSHRGLWHRVEFALELIPALDPTFIDAYLLRAYMLDTRMKLYDEALQVLESAVKQVPNRMELWQQIGIYCLNYHSLHGQTRRLPRALEAFRLVCNFQEAPPYAIRLVAITLAAMERREEAIKILESSAASPERTDDQRRIDRLTIDRVKSNEKF